MPKVTFEPQNADSLRRIAAQLAEFSGQLRSVADLMQDEGFESLLIGNYDQQRRGMAFLDSFRSAAMTALRKAREERGDFSAEKPTKKGAKK